MLRLLPALLLVSCAAEVSPRAEPGDPRVLPLGAMAALDGSFSEGDNLTYVWSVSPDEGVTLTEVEGPFASLTAEAPGFYTLSLEVCDAEGRCDVAETWARVEERGSAAKITDFGIDEFAGVESGAGAPLGVFKDKDLCAKCKEAAKGTSSQWEDFCRTLAKKGVSTGDRNACWAAVHHDSNERNGWCETIFCP